MCEVYKKRCAWEWQNSQFTVKARCSWSTNWKDVNNVSLGFGIKYELKSLIDCRKVTGMQVFEFKKEALGFFPSLWHHAVGKSPLRSLCVQGVWNVCLQISWRDPQDLRADLWENFKKVVSYKQLPSTEAGAAKLELSNFLSTTVKENKDPFVKFDKETDRVDTFIWQFFLGTTNLSCCERCSKFWWYYPMVEQPWKENLVFYPESLNCSETYPQRHAELWFAGSWCGYYTWIIGLCQFCKKTSFSEPEREIFGKRKVF